MLSTDNWNANPEYLYWKWLYPLNSIVSFKYKQIFIYNAFNSWICLVAYLPIEIMYSVPDQFENTMGASHHSAVI